MGASDFHCVAVARSFGEAFAAARAEAAYEYGHGGYTGTIAEVDSFVAVPLPARMPVATYIDLVQAVHAAAYDDPSGFKLAAPRDPGIRRKFTDDYDRRRHDDAKKLWAAWSRLPEWDRRGVLAAAERMGDKWGPCTAVELRGKEAAETKARMARYGRGPARGKAFVFFGMASS
jgi:hypothetical protein